MRFRKRAFSCLIAACLTLSLLPTPVQAQTQRQIPGTIRVQVTVVPVDVLVTDEKGQPVLDLSKEDFIVLENGTPQEIAHFSLETFGRPEASSPLAPTTASSEETLLDSPNHRTFLIVLGRGQHTRYFKAVDRMIQFVREGLSPADLVAVMAYNRATDFTTEHEKIAEVLERYKDINRWIEVVLKQRFRGRHTINLGKGAGLAALYGSKTLPKSLQSKVDEIFSLPELGSRRLAAGDVLDQEEQDQLEGEALESVGHKDMDKLLEKMQEQLREGGLATLPQDLQRFRGLETIQLQLMTDLPFDEYMQKRAGTNQDLMNIYAAIEYLRFAKGEKHLLFFTSQGLFLPDMKDDESLASMASDARVRIHNFQTGGTELRMDWAPVARPGRRMARGSFTGAFALSSLRNVSSLTGGRAFIAADIGKALRSINQITSAVYLLGYRPQDENFDGKFRRIEVRVRRKDLKVYSRSGYYARSILEPYDREQFMTYARTVSAAEHAEPINDVVFSGQVTKPKFRENETKFDIVLTIQMHKDMFVSKERVHAGKLAVTSFLVSDKGKLLSDVWQRLNLSLTTQDYQGVLSQGLSLSRSFSVPGRLKKGWLKIIVYDPANDKVGSLLKRIH
ncbi:VWA domain-containing protein [Acidobacteria bacterium AH-259-A15]|nr:VWA domain-containing protein [Acidobacteria bacterium AH-259-A15]